MYRSRSLRSLQHTPRFHQQPHSKNVYVSPLSHYPRHTHAHQAWEQSNRRDRLNLDFPRACTHVLPRSSNKTSLTIPPGRPHTHSPGTRPVDAQTQRALYEFHNRLPWSVMSSHTSPAPHRGRHPNAQLEEYSCFSCFPHIFSLFACSLCWKAHTFSEFVGGYFYKGLFPKYTTCPITDTLTASHVTRREASGHWLTVLGITRFKRHRQIIRCFEATTWWILQKVFQHALIW